MCSRLICVALLTSFAMSAIPSAQAFCPVEGDSFWTPGMYTIPKEFDRSKYVVRVRSLSETWLDEDGKPTSLKPPFRNGSPHPLGMDPYLGAIYELEILEVFKGSPPKRLKLFSSNTTARVLLPVNSEFLLFIQESVEKDEVGFTIHVDNCGNSSPKPYDAQTLRQLQALAGRKN